MGIIEDSEKRMTSNRFATPLNMFRIINKNWWLPYLFLLISCLHCQHSLGQDLPIELKDSLENYKLIGKVKQIEYKLYDAEIVEDTFLLASQINLSRGSTKLVFNKAGFLTEKSRCNMYQEECKHKRYKYDSNLRLLDYQNIEKDSIIIAQNQYSYGPFNLVAKQIKYLRETEGFQMSDIIAYKYDQQHRLTQVNRFEGDDEYKGKFTYIYEDNQQEWVVFEEVDDDGEVEKHIEQKFDNKGRTVQKVTEDEGLLLEKRTAQYENDSLASSTNYNYVDGNFVLRDAEHIHFGRENEKSTFHVVGNNGVPDTTKYEWVIFDELGSPIYKQKCKTETIVYETHWTYNELKQVLSETRVDYQKSITSNWHYTYYPNGKLESEEVLRDTGFRELNKWYYDEVGNWTHRIEHLRTSDLELTHLHKRDIHYFD